MFAFILFLGSLFGSAQPPSTSYEDNMLSPIPLNTGEVLDFRLKYGWFTVGRAQWLTDSQYHDYDGEECYKFKVTAESSGILGAFARVEDEWGEYMRVDDFMPMMTYRDLLEGKYILDEKIYYDYADSLITMEWTRKGKEMPTEYTEMDVGRVGMLGGFMKMRCLDYSKYEVGDLIHIESFFEGEIYQMEIEYRGTEVLESLVGDVLAHKVIPRLPESTLFPGEDPVTMWVSADQNQLPLKAKARMYFGTAYVELSGYKNIKFGPDFIDD